MLNLVRALIPNAYVRALVLKGLRWGGAAAGGAIAAWLVKKGIPSADATSVSEAVAALVLAGGSALFSYIDAKKVDTQVKTTEAATAGAVAAGIQSGAVTPAQVQTQATAALVEGDGAAKQLSQTIATLKAGQA